MKINSKTLLTLLLFALLTSGFIMNTAHAQIKATKMKQRPQSMEKQIKISYPQTRQDNSVSDNYHGTTVKDPYRWLEDDTSEETMNWVDTQNEVTNSYIAIIPFKEKIKERLTALWDYEKVGAPFKEGDWYYFFKNDGLQNQSVLYRSREIGGRAEIFFDPNKLSADGTSSLGGYSFSKDGNYFAYAVSEGGSDWRTAYVMNVNNSERLNDKIEWIKFSSLSWQGKGFFYSRYPSPYRDEELSGQNQYHKVYYHRLGTDQSQDKLIIEDKANPSRNFYATTTEDERYLIISSVESTSGNALYVIDLMTKDRKIRKVVDNFEHDFSVIDNDGESLLVLTNKNAPNKRLIRIRMSNYAEAFWEDVIPETMENLQSVSIVGGKMFANYIRNASTRIAIFDLKGIYIRDLQLPGIGNCGGIRGKKLDREGFFSFTSFTYPTTVFRLNADKLTYDVYQKPSVDFKPDDFVTKQEWFTSKDGTKIPMFITHKKGLRMDGSNPTLLYGYGGFNISLLPSFSLTRIPLLENGGIYVVANIRGGGEFGTAWHKSGTLDQKQNVFDDFQMAAEYLIEKKYTSSAKLAIEGGSNGGLLVGACITQRPDLYAVAFPSVGVLDMLRYHKFTIGWAWAGDYGKSDDPEAFEYLYKYSPLHNIKKADYPATLVTTADHDDRVVPAHSFKFIAELQKKHTGLDPVLIRIDKSAGHGAGKPTSKVIDEAADKLSFMLHIMGEQYTKVMEDPDTK